jgi:hypothetical protein
MQGKNGATKKTCSYPGNPAGQLHVKIQSISNKIDSWILKAGTIYGGRFF